MILNPTSFFFSDPTAGGASATYFYPYTIDQACRFDGSAAYAQHTAMASGDTEKFTFSVWVKRSGLGALQNILDAGTSYVRFTATDTLDCLVQTSGATEAQKATTYQFSDTSMWYHIVLACDLNNPVESLVLWINGCRVTEFGTNTDTTTPGTDTLVDFNTAIALDIGRDAAPSQYLDGYLAEFNYVDALALSASDFGQLIDGIWCPKLFSGTYGTNGLYHKFVGTSSTTIKADDSGNSANIDTTAGIATTDIVIDTPTNNFSTVGLFTDGVAPTLSEGNLKVTTGGGTGFIWGTMPMPRTGKWYFESLTLGATYKSIGMGITEPNGSTTASYVGNSSGLRGGGLTSDATPTQHVYVNGAQVSSSYAEKWDASGEWGQIAYDADTGDTWCGINDTWFDNSGGATGNPSTGVNPTFNLMSHNGVEADTSATTRMINPVFSFHGGSAQFVNFGQGGQSGLTDYTTDHNGWFAYDPPDGFKALCFKSLYPSQVGTDLEERFDGYEDTGDVTIANSLLCNRADSAYMHVTPSAGDNNTLTWALWFKRSGDLSLTHTILSGGTAGNHCAFGISTDGTLDIQTNGGIATYLNFDTTRPIMDHEWHHYVIKYDDTQALDTARFSFYIDGVMITDWVNEVYPNQNIGTNGWGEAKTHDVGRYLGGINHCAGYFADVYYINGKAYPPEMFGKFVEGNWVPITYAGDTTGTGSFHLKFEDSANFGYDEFSTSNLLTEVNQATTDQSTDTPTNSFPILSVTSGDPTEEGGLKILFDESPNEMAYAHEFPIPNTGKWYIEAYWDAAAGSYKTGVENTQIGLIQLRYGHSTNANIEPASPAGWINMSDDASVWGISRRDSGATITRILSGNDFNVGDWVAIAIDMDADQVSFYINNSLEVAVQSMPMRDNTWGDDVTNPWIFAIGKNGNTGDNPTWYVNFGGADPGGHFGANTDENGFGAFQYSPPSGFLALCDSNIRRARGEYVT